MSFPQFLKTPLQYPMEKNWRPTYDRDKPAGTYKCEYNVTSSKQLKKKKNQSANPRQRKALL